ncbi:MAG: OmpA family protein [Bacteroidia bacterium]|nr:OmpA family protein [Bacteroidia bacterium]
MQKTINRILFFIFIIFFVSCSKVHYYLFRANLALENTKTDKAEYWYKKALKVDSLNFRANCEYGLMLGEWMNLHDKALPYLENAYKKMPKDTNWNLMHGLAKAYQHNERYQDALKILSYMTDMKTWDGEDKNELILDIQKRKSDCEWALLNSKDVSQVFITTNLGSKINSDKPEYVPLMASNGELFFTSKRKDADRERFSLLDGKYFEAIYYNDPKTGQINRYVIPENHRKKLKRNRYHESLVSYSNNKKVYFYFSKGELFEVHADSLKYKNPRKMSKNINFEYYHNHAFLTSDGKTLFFTSDAEGGEGGLDIYVSEKQPNGTWGKAVNLGKDINTPFDEDAPFFDEKNQILYFSSKGHPGFGFYDVYASQKQDGKFLPPINLGKPLNSGGNDIFYTLTPYDFALHSSSRTGGFGDMDIYKVWNTLDWEKRPCRKINLSYAERKIDEKTYAFEIQSPEKILKSVWESNVVIKEQFPDKVTIELSSPSDNIKIRWKGLIIPDSAHYLSPYCIDIERAGEAITLAPPLPLPKDNELSGNAWISGPDLEKLSGITNPNIYFGFDSYRVPAEEKQKIQHMAKWIINYGYQISIEAFADDRGSDNYNILLSQKRAQSIKELLIKFGVPANDIIDASGKGKYPTKEIRYVEQRVGAIKIRKK